MDDESFASIYNDSSQYETLMEVAEVLGVSRRTVSNKAAKLKAQHKLGKSDIFLIDRSGLKSSPKEIEFSFKEIPQPIEKTHPGKGIKRFILTSAQDCTKVFEPFLNNLLAYNSFLNKGKNSCEFLVAGFTYNKSLFEDHDHRHSWYDEKIRPYLVYERVNLGDDIVFCGEMNTLPTATMPLSGFEAYTKGRWGIFPHAKVQLVSVATQKHLRAKQIMTTGACTLPNYVQKKAGIKAQFHHIFGAVLVEICEDGTFFCRHLIGDREGNFQDLDRKVENGIVTTGHRIEALTYGDTHHERIDKIVEETTWNSKNCLLDFLKPKYQFFHDIIDFSHRNHHSIGDIHHQFQTSLDKKKTVEQSIKDCAEFIKNVSRDFCKTCIVQSNHDNALTTWLKTADYRVDPINAIIFLELQLRYYTDLKFGVEPRIFEIALKKYEELKYVKFLDEDGSFIICDEIECALHGHLGANGSRGSAKQFTKIGVKVNVGHSHSPQILDGVYQAGCSCELDMGYNRGLSSWAHSHIITYPNGKRSLITMNQDRWFA